VRESAVLTNDLSNEALGNISNASSIKDYLVWPESPIRKGNRNSERMPFVLTSEHWKTLQAEKREKKIQKKKRKRENANEYRRKKKMS
jgi:DNA primase